MKAKMDDLKKTYGAVQELVTPSGFKVIIREQTGEDDDILSRAGDTSDGTSANKFIQAIVVDSGINDKGRLSLDEVRDLKLCDKYFIMIASRIFSISQILKFSYTWGEGLEPVEYEEDLGQYIWDYGNEEKPFPKLSDPEYFKYRIEPHPAGKESIREFTTKSGKKIRYNFMNGHGESYLMKIPMDKQSVNQELLSRDIHLWMGDKWVKVYNFKPFSSIDMMEIRMDVDKNDPLLEFSTDLTNPATGEKISYPLLASNDFFYPREI